MRRLHLGCGRVHCDGYVNLDLVPLPGVEVVADVERSLPFCDDAFQEVLAVHVLEHVSQLVGLLEELGRVTRGGGRIRLVVPHFSFFGAYTDPTHKRFFGYHSFDYFTEGTPYDFYTRVRFHIIKRRLRFYWIKNERRTIESRVLGFLINLWPLFYERFLCWALPVNEIYFELEPVSPSSPRTSS